MSNLSPGLNARFANIDLETSSNMRTKAPRSSRKLYPASLYPETQSALPNTTPSQAPRLSTALRAENRSSSHSKPSIPSSASHKRNLHSAQSKDDDLSDNGRHEDKHTKYPEPNSHSFMKETSSSRKKQLSVDRKTSQTRSSSHSDIYSRRTHHYAALASKKRQVSKASKSPDAEETPEQAVKVHFADKPTMFTSYSPSRNVSAGHTVKPSEDVYTRLYESSKKSRVPVDKPAKPTFISHHPRTSGAGTSTKSGSPPVQREKPATIAEMYRMIYKADPGFFVESTSADSPLVARDPISAADLVNSSENTHLNVYERGEIMRHTNLYYVPSTGKESAPNKDINVSSFKNNYGFDDQDGNYIIRPQDHIEYRYEIVRVLGTGSFGNVVHCKDHKYSHGGQYRNVAIKLIKNELDWSLQAVSEIKMLKHLMGAMHGNINSYIMNYCDHFHFRGHMCIVSEILSLNLYTFLELGGFRGVSLDLVKNFSFKILNGLKFVHDQKVIHCDIKPENIMIRLPSNYSPNDTDVMGFDVKLIDFGSSCFVSETSFSYIQSRYYRAPEVILGAKYSYEIDIWSFGCVVAELFTGSPLLPGKNELEQIALILELFGAPPSAWILAERKKAC